MRHTGLLLILAIIIFGLAQAPARADEGKLLKIVALSRHGVRSPTQPAKVLAEWSQKTWPDWPVPAGDLTPRGARLITAMWEDMRQKMSEWAMLPEKSCPRPGEVYVRADVDERTRATAAALLEGLAPDCQLGYAVVEGKVDPLFHPLKAGLYKFNPIAAVTDVLTMTDGGLDGLQEQFSGLLTLLGEITGAPSPTFCTKFSGTSNCQIADLPNAISVSPNGADIHLVGALSIASSLAEIFLLEYAQWPGVPAGWGQINATTLGQILPIHSKIFDVINRAPVIAWAKGSALLTEMTAALTDTHYDQRCNEARLVVFVGHDTNIANIGGLLGVTWRASGYPANGIPPGSVMFLELWERNGKKQVVVRFYAQPPAALHAAFKDDAIGDPAVKANGHMPVAATVNAPPVVGEARFPLETFRQLVGNVTEGAPLAPRQTPKLEFGAPKATVN